MVSCGQFQGGAVGRLQQGLLPVASSLPDRAYRVDHIPGRQTVTFGDFGLTGFASPKGAAFFQKLGTGCPVDGSIHSAASQQAFIGRIDNGIHLHGGDIVPDDLKGHKDTSRFL